MKFYAVRKRSMGFGGQRLWVLENERGWRIGRVDAQPTYESLLTAATREGFSIVDIELKYRRPVSDDELRKRVERAMWAGDVELLCELAPCGCCCDEHTHEGCPARLWEGCRGGGSMTTRDLEAWIKHYEVHHGMSRDTFFGA